MGELELDVVVLECGELELDVGVLKRSGFEVVLQVPECIEIEVDLGVLKIDGLGLDLEVLKLGELAWRRVQLLAGKEALRSGALFQAPDSFVAEGDRKDTHLLPPLPLVLTGQVKVSSVPKKGKPSRTSPHKRKSTASVGNP